MQFNIYKICCGCLLFTCLHCGVFPGQGSLLQFFIRSFQTATLPCRCWGNASSVTVVAWWAQTPSMATQSQHQVLGHQIPSILNKKFRSHRWVLSNHKLWLSICSKKSIFELSNLTQRILKKLRLRVLFLFRFHH